MPTRVLLLMACSATMFHGTSGFSIPAFFNARGLPAATSGAAALQRPDVETPRSWSVGGKSMPWQRQTEKRRVAMTMTETESTQTAVEQDVPDLRSTPPIKVGLIVEPTPFTHVSGYSNRYKEMLTYLKMAGDDVEIVTPDDTVDPPTEFLGYPISYTPGVRFSLYNQIVLSTDFQLEGLKMVRRFSPDVMHVTSPSQIALVSSIVAKLFNVPLVLTYHTHLPVYAERYLGWVPGIVFAAWTVLRFVHGQADLTLVTSPQLKEEFRLQGITNVDVWRKGIDTVNFNPKWRSQATREMLSDGHPDALIITYVGRLGKEKRIEDLRPIMDRLPNVRLAIVGKGPHEEQLKEVFAGTNTVFTGMLTGEPLWSAFASADVFCMPSDSETLGFVVLESMASGVPVIGARAGGIPDNIRDGDTGFLHAVGDSEAIIEKVKWFEENRGQAPEMGRKGRVESERWSWEKATSVLRNVQYPKAIRRRQEENLRTSPVMRVGKIALLTAVGLVATAIVAGFGNIDRLLNRRKD